MTIEKRKGGKSAALAYLLVQAEKEGWKYSHLESGIKISKSSERERVQILQKEAALVELNHGLHKVGNKSISPTPSSLLFHPATAFFYFPFHICPYISIVYN